MHKKDPSSFLRDSSSPNVRVGQSLQWVNRLLGVTRDISQQGTSSKYLQRFCPEFYAVLKDIGPGYKSVSGRFDVAIPDELKHCVNEIEGLDNQVRVAIGWMRAGLSRPEAILIEYLRHCACHVFQEDYLDKFSQPGRGKTVGIIGPPNLVPIAEVETAIDENLRKYGALGEHNFVVEVATRVLPKVDELLSAFENLRPLTLKLVCQLTQRGLLSLKPPC